MKIFVLIKKILTSIVGVVSYCISNTKPLTYDELYPKDESYYERDSWYNYDAFVDRNITDPNWD